MKALMNNYTEQEIKNIKENLMKTFGQEYLSVYTRIRELQKNQKNFNIHKGAIYYVYLSMDNKEYNKPKGWYPIFITYKRTGILFFSFLNGEELEKKEYWFVEQSPFTAFLVPAVIELKEYGIPDHNLDLIKFEKDVPFDITIVKNNGETFIV